MLALSFATACTLQYHRHHATANRDALNSCHASARPTLKAERSESEQAEPSRVEPASLLSRPSTFESEAQASQRTKVHEFIASKTRRERRPVCDERMPSSSSTPFDHPHSPSSPSHANNGHHHSSSPATPSSSSLKIKLSKRPRPEDAAPTPPAYLSQVDQAGPSRLSSPPRNGNGHHDYATPAAATPPASSSTAEWTPPVVPTPPWPSQKKKRVAPPVDIHEGLSKLIQSFVKKDAYGFFLAPVDEAEVPGYRTVSTLR